MVSEASKSLSKAAAIPPPYKPYLTPDYATRPRLPRMVLNTNDLATWRAMESRAPGKKDISFHMRKRRHISFVIAAYLCHDCAPFGGMSAQISHIAHLLSIAPTEHCNYALMYRRELVRFLADAARARAYRSIFGTVYRESRRRYAK